MNTKKETLALEIKSVLKAIEQVDKSAIDHSLMSLIEEMRTKSEYLIYRDEFGRMLEPLELEVARLVDEGIQRNEKKKILTKNYIKPKRIAGFKSYKKGEWHGEANDPDRDVWTDAIDYLEIVFGKYLSRFNDEKIDFLYLDQLDVILPKFRNNLYNHAKKRGETLFNFVKSGTERSDSEALIYKTSDVSKDHNRIHAAFRRAIKRIKGKE